MKKAIVAAGLLALLLWMLRESRLPAAALREAAGAIAARAAGAASAAGAAGEGISSKKPAETAQPAATGSAFSRPEAEKILLLHNQARAAVGAHPLNWSQDLARYAQEWADHLAAAGCSFEHRPESGPWKQKHGENLFMGTAGYYGAAEAVDSWISEKRQYNGQTIDEANYHEFGHYTQLVWKATKEVGCGQALCNGEVIIVCNYAPAGNLLGERAW
ncbi:MAG TPA: CAP domain-containing protein [bacterium]|nr:CAP domain-containing protein [bacterium]